MTWTQGQHHICIKTLTVLLINLLQWDLQWGSLMLLFLSFPFFLFFLLIPTLILFFTKKKIYHEWSNISNKKLTVTFLQWGVLGRHILCLFVFLVSLNLISFSKKLFWSYTNRTLFFQCPTRHFAPFGLEIIHRTSITRPLEVPCSLMIQRTLITWYSTPRGI